MDQLKKVLEYKFWIMLGIACLCPIVGWYLTNTAAAESLKSRSSKLDSTYNALKVDPNPPNLKWKETVSAFNKSQIASVDQTWKMLYEAQQAAKWWPAGMIPLEKAKSYELAEYPPKYEEEWKRVYQIPRPLTAAGEGVVDFPEKGVMAKVDWGETSPTALMIYNAQEDLWMYEALLEAIAEVNSNYTSQSKAAIRKIEQLDLLRGTGSGRVTGGTSGPAPAGASPGTNTGGNKSVPAAGAPPAGMMPSTQAGGPAGTGPGVGTGSSSAGSGTGGVDFKWTDEFGTSDDKGSPIGNEPTKNRYVDRGTYYNTRGFYMKVVMDHNAVPRLLISLSNSKKWPIVVVRVHQKDVIDQEPELQSTAQSDSGSGGAGGAGGADGDPMRSRKSSKGMGMKAPAAEGDAAGEDVAANPNAKNLQLDPELAHVCICGLITIYEPPAGTVAVNAPPGTPPAGNAPPGGNAPGGNSPPGNTSPGSSAPAATPAGSTPMGNTPMAGGNAPGANAAGAKPMETPNVGTAGSAPASKTGDATKPAEAKPGDAKPADTKPADTKPGEAKPGEAKPSEAKPSVDKPAEVKPAEGKSVPAAGSAPPKT